MILMKKYLLSKAPASVVVKGSFEASCYLELSDEALASLESRKLRIQIVKHGGKATIEKLSIVIKAISGNIVICIGNDDSEVFFDTGSSGAYDLRLWRESKVSIGKNTTSNGARIVCDNSEFICGEDCMFSDSILIQGGDQHGIVDLESGTIINEGYKSIVLGEHVWLGRGVTLMPNVMIGNGCIIGAQSLVTKNIPEKSIAAGVSAKIIKSNMSWSRSPINLDPISQDYVNSF